MYMYICMYMDIQMSPWSSYEQLFFYPTYIFSFKLNIFLFKDNYNLHLFTN